MPGRNKNTLYLPVLLSVSFACHSVAYSEKEGIFRQLLSKWLNNLYVIYFFNVILIGAIPPAMSLFSLVRLRKPRDDKDKRWSAG
jgi:hypothetical protein